MELYVSSLSDRARDKATNQIYAIKHVIPDNEGVISNQLAITSFREIEILLSIDHPHIAKLIEVVTGRKGVFLVLEYGGRDLAYLYDSSASRASLSHHPSPTLYTESQIKKFIRDLLRAVAYLHQQGIIHRDLKLSNLLIDEENNLKLCDFGLARRYARNLTPNVVTLWYRAPEILLGCRDYSQAIDMWSVGCIFAEMLNNGKPILPGNNEADQFQQICRLIGEPNENIWPRYAEIRHNFSVPRNPYNTLNLLFSNYSHECLDFLNSLLVWDPSKRLTASEALLNSYLTY